MAPGDDARLNLLKGAGIQAVRVAGLGGPGGGPGPVWVRNPSR